MKNLKNSVQLEGFAGSDPKIFNLEGGKRMAKLSMAVNDSYRDSEGKSKTHWFDLIFWNNKMTLVEDTVKKGTRFSIKGSLTTQTYTDKDKKNITKTAIVVNHLEIIRGEEDQD
ncbi:single-stranded DNA-binding protein [Pedobacter sp. MC2016-24]|uniref:single-stranded DNA-binding protein n=1 Tax=Pedobacter sp. MC2016-24 TaxID=2780090 RepID=UPI001882D7E4|nr:single-stranded DNA-binding protein [Pedobacter sp. MC2016-24]MBE9599880.1 single-stranded DNA-binding protein [Pedobacter sp. MC2016-24]